LTAFENIVAEFLEHSPSSRTSSRSRCAASCQSRTGPPTRLDRGWNRREERQHDARHTKSQIVTRLHKPPELFQNRGISPRARDLSRIHSIPRRPTT
jgi:hypothetical protein